MADRRVGEVDEVLVVVYFDVNKIVVLINADKLFWNLAVNMCYFSVYVTFFKPPRGRRDKALIVLIILLIMLFHQSKYNCQ